MATLVQHETNFVDHSPATYEADMESDELEEALWMQSEFKKSNVEYKAPQNIRPSVHMVRGRASLFDPEPYDDEFEQEIYQPVKMIRGRPFRNVKPDIRPGGLQEHDTTRQIREVCGLGYSNEIIEYNLKRQIAEAAATTSAKNDEATTSAKNGEKSGHEMPNLGFISSQNPTTSQRRPRTSKQTKVHNPFSKSIKADKYDITNDTQFPKL